MAGIQELAQGWKDNPETVQVLFESAQKDRTYIVRETAVLALKKGWSDDEELARKLQSLYRPSSKT